MMVVWSRTASVALGGGKPGLWSPLGCPWGLIAGCALSLLGHELLKDGLSHYIGIWFKPMLDVKLADALSKVTTDRLQGVHLPALGLFVPIPLGWADRQPEMELPMTEVCCQFAWSWGRVGGHVRAL